MSLRFQKKQNRLRLVFFSRRMNYMYCTIYRSEVLALSFKSLSILFYSYLPKSFQINPPLKSKLQQKKLKKSLNLGVYDGEWGENKKDVGISSARGDKIVYPYAWLVVCYQYSVVVSSVVYPWQNCCCATVYWLYRNHFINIIIVQHRFYIICFVRYLVCSFERLMLNP